MSPFHPSLPFGGPPSFDPKQTFRDPLAMVIDACMMGPKIRAISQTRPTETGYQDIIFAVNGKLRVTPRVRYVIDGYQPPCDELPYCDEMGLDNP